MKALIFSFALIVSSSFGFSNPAPAEFVSCPAPSNVAVVAQTYNSIGFDWDDCGCSFTEYRIYYVKDGQASAEFSTPNSEFSISGLSAGNYQFHFYTICGTNSSIIIIEDVVMG